MEVIENTPMKLVLRVPAKAPLLNAIRRSINEIKTLAFDEVEIFKNDSALYDEFLAHRIGLVPLKSENGMNDKTEIACKLVKKGPGMVLSGDFEGNLEMVHKDIPLTLLENEQEVEIIATARLGKGVEHEKYSPGLCYYRNLFVVDAKNSQIEAIVNGSRGSIKPEKQKDGWLCDLSESVINEIEKIDSKAVADSDEMIFVIESFGQMSAKEILLKSIKALNENVVSFEKSL